MGGVIWAISTTTRTGGRLLSSETVLAASILVGIALPPVSRLLDPYLYVLVLFLMLFGPVAGHWPALMFITACAGTTFGAPAFAHVMRLDVLLTLRGVLAGTLLMPVVPGLLAPVVTRISIFSRMRDGCAFSSSCRSSRRACTRHGAPVKPAKIRCSAR